MWKTLMFALVMMACVLSVTAVNVDTNLTLRAECVNTYGQACNENARWTVLDGNGTTIYNNTIGGQYHYGISNFTVWFNSTGVWFVVANFTSQNITREYNVVVEDYGITALREDFNMTGIYILFGIIIFSLFYAGFMFGKDHQAIKWLLVLTGVLALPVAMQVVRIGTDSITGGLVDTLLQAFTWIVAFVVLYLVLYSLYVVLLNKGKIKTSTGGKNG